MAKSSVTEVLYVPRWLVLGAFPASTTGPTLVDAIPNETRLMPSPGQATEGRIWQTVTANPVDFLDSKIGFKQTESCFAYAFTYVYVPNTEKVELLSGSDDGIAIWVNGKLVHFFDGWRGVELDNDCAPAVLRAGWNALLVKISQGNGEWGFVLRIRRTAPDGEMAFSLNRAQAKVGAKGKETLAMQPVASRFVPAVQDGRLLLHMGVDLMSDYAKPLVNMILQVVDDTGAVHGQAALQPLAPFGATQATVPFAAEGIFSALAAGHTARLEARITETMNATELKADVLVGMLLDLLYGFELSAVGGTFTVPMPFRGQTATLEVRSAREISTAGQAIAARPKLATRTYSAEETARGEIDLTIAVPAVIRDPAACLWFGSAEMREQIKRIRFMLNELKADPGAAHAAVLDGLRALAAGDLAATESALADVLTALATTLPDLSAHRVTLVGHAHIDMNWLWDTAETVQVTHDTFRQVLAFMDEFPQFTFSQSQSSTYQFIERIDPPMFERIRQRVREGRWELLGGMVDEGDTNLSGGEAIARSMLMGQRYFRSRFGKLAKVGWLPDDFGHIAQLPQLLRLAGMSAFYGFRCMPQKGPFLWEGVDGTRVTNYITATYNGDVTPFLRLLPGNYDPRHGKLLWVYGVGDHGGGPTRRDITRAEFYQTVPTFPKITFGSAADFFESLKEDAADYPLYKGEMQYIFEGCYTSISRIKEGNRACENALFNAELLAAMMARHGCAYPKQQLDDAWYTVAFNQFHDILCGSAIHDSNRESVAAYDLALAKAREVTYAALRGLAARVPTAEDQGQPVVVFNPQPIPRTDVVEADLFTYTLPPSVRFSGSGWMRGVPEEAMKKNHINPIDVGQGEFATIALKDADGNPVDAQVVRCETFPSGYRMKVRFLASEVPPCGWRLFYARTDQEGMPVHCDLQVRGTTVETPDLLVKVDPKTGHVTRIYDKRRGEEVLPRGKKANVLKIYLEKPHGMSAWSIGPSSEVITLDDAELVRVTETGPVRATIEVWRRWNRSLFVQRIFVYRDVPRVEFALDAHWFERGGPDVDAPMLRVAFPINVKKGAFTCETPYAAIERPTTGQEVPVQRWVDLSSEDGGAALLNDSKYGFRCEKNVLEMTLLRASYEPDPFPEIGPHYIRYALLPHAGDWRAANIAGAGQAFNLPLLALETPAGQSGQTASTGELLSLAPAGVQLSGVKRAEDDDALVVRFAEMYGQATTASLSLPAPILAAERVDLLEDPLPAAPAPQVTGNTLQVPVRAHEIVTLKVRLAEG